eukprot:COSAG04_NODE_13455_length_605_cov_1.832016_1_plen_185_part_10
MHSSLNEPRSPIGSLIKVVDPAGIEPASRPPIKVTCDHQFTKGPGRAVSRPCSGRNAGVAFCQKSKAEPPLPLPLPPPVMRRSAGPSGVGGAAAEPGENRTRPSRRFRHCPALSVRARQRDREAFQGGSGEVCVGRERFCVLCLLWLPGLSRLAVIGKNLLRGLAPSVRLVPAVRLERRRRVRAG